MDWRIIRDGAGAGIGEVQPAARVYDVPLAGVSAALSFELQAQESPMLVAIWPLATCGAFDLSSVSNPTLAKACGGAVGDRVYLNLPEAVRTGDLVFASAGFPPGAMVRVALVLLSFDVR